jgi:hypothetical protein
MTRAARWAVVLVTAVFAAAGCGHRLQQVLLPDSRPQLQLDRVRLDPPTPGSYAYIARWTGLPIGRAISHYVYAIDPASVDAVDATWVRTTATQRVLTFPIPDKGAPGRQSHVFVVRAVDDRGEMSDPRWIAVAASNIPPSVRITHPVPSALFPALVPPTIRIDWQGTDPDGQTTITPVRYVFRLFAQQNPDFPAIQDFISFALTHPDSLRSLYAPGFTGWESVGAEQTSHEYNNLTPYTDYLFVITGFDEVGDYDPVFSANKNMLEMWVVAPGSTGPVLTMFNEMFSYTYPNGGWSNDISREVVVEFPTNQAVTVKWFATAPGSANIAWYRWALDATDLTNETPRGNEATDLYRWSARSRTTTSATVGPYNPLGPKTLSHRLYIEAEDSNGLRSLGIVNFIIRRPISTNELLFVDDTRLRVDLRSTPGPDPDPPAGPWPTRAELDTFLFAKGGYPWRGYPAGTLTTPGIFNGYRFDTLSTRGMLDGVPLSVLAGYRHVVWYTDEIGATVNQPPDETALRQMSAPGHGSTLKAYVQQGGKLWLCGGGAAYATLIDWNRFSPNEYTARDGELVPGRMMYDFAHWRQGVQMLLAVQARRFGTTAYGGGGFPRSAGRSWPPNPLPPTPPAPPNYALLPAVLQPKNPATDPLPPLRLPDSFFYRGDFQAEYIFFSPTFIREDYDDDPDRVSEYSTLDTLYITSGGTALQNAACMTYYHGREHQPFVFSGFNFWYWRRPQCIGLVDWVLNSVWGLERDPGAPRGPGAAPQGPLASRPVTRTP